MSILIRSINTKIRFGRINSTSENLPLGHKNIKTQGITTVISLLYWER